MTNDQIKQTLENLTFELIQTNITLMNQQAQLNELKTGRLITDCDSSMAINSRLGRLRSMFKN